MILRFVVRAAAEAFRVARHAAALGTVVQELLGLLPTQANGLMLKKYEVI